MQATVAANAAANVAGTASALRDALIAIVGVANVRDDDATRRLHSEDVFEASRHVVTMIVAPRSLDELAAVVAVAHGARVSLAPRGAGMSYTAAYLPADDRTVSLDLSAMNRVLHVRADDMTVTVEAGCSWATLDAALAPLGLRSPFWGPMSGIYSTVGGGVSQLNAMFGAGHHGTSSESVVALTVVLGDGRILRTGARGPDGDTPFYRHYGPDLAGLFCGDCGTLGIKAEVTLRLIRRPGHEAHLSFAFADADALLAAMAEIARAGVACETCAFDPGLTRARMKRQSLASDLRTLGAVAAGGARSGGGIGKGLMAAAKVALGGRDFIAGDTFPLHVIAEGRSAAAVAADVAEARAIAARCGGTEIANSIATILRATPFPEPTSMLGADGEAWVPVHGLVSLSNAPAMYTAIAALFADMAPAFAEHGISTGALFTTMATNAILIEPVFFWPHAWRPVHEAMLPPAHLAGLTRRAPNPDATAVVAAARAGVVAIVARFGGAHFQIGRAYPYRASRDAASCALLDAVKAAVDPHARFNPGGLGFAVEDD